MCVAGDDKERRYPTTLPAKPVVEPPDEGLGQNLEVQFRRALSQPEDWLGELPQQPPAHSDSGDDY